MGFVIKKGGKRQKFSSGKVRKSIEKAAREAGLSGEKMKEIFKEVGGAVVSLYKKRVVKTSVLRKSILGRLDRKAKSVASAWRRFDRKRKI